MTNGRAKGAQFERDVARMCYEHLGFEAKRDLEQYRSGDRGDLIGVPGWVIECKRYASGSTYKQDWWRQVTKAADAAMCEPVLIYKYDRQSIRCVVFLSSINPEYWGKADTAEVSFETWCMIVREGLTDEQHRQHEYSRVQQSAGQINGTT
jgi:Holliday junction resolvase